MRKLGTGTSAGEFWSMQDIGIQEKAWEIPGPGGGKGAFWRLQTFDRSDIFGSRESLIAR